jgi:thioredoxin-dependent peroxiredoxin
MKRTLSFLAAFAAFGVLSTPAQATLPVGAAAPAFTTQASLAGSAFTFKLADALKKGPVVLYFYPKAFTKGCTAEAHEFSEAADTFKANGATVIGMSADDIETLHKFSVDTTACSGKFAVGVADKDVIKAYDVALPMLPITNRTSYVIAPDGKVLLTFSDMKADQHVTKTLEAVKAYKAAHP